MMGEPDAKFGRCKYYIKSDDTPLLMYECIQLLETLIKNGMLQQDLGNRNSILVYCAGNQYNKEGWYSRNLMTVAEELLYDTDAQKYLREVLASKGIDLVFTNIMGKNLDEMEGIISAHNDADMVKESRYGE